MTGESTVHPRRGRLIHRASRTLDPVQLPQTGFIHCSASRHKRRRGSAFSRKTHTIPPRNKSGFPVEPAEGRPPRAAAAGNFTHAGGETRCLNPRRSQRLSLFPPKQKQRATYPVGFFPSPSSSSSSLEIVSRGSACATLQRHLSAGSLTARMPSEHRGGMREGEAGCGGGEARERGDKRPGRRLAHWRSSMFLCGCSIHNHNIIFIIALLLYKQLLVSLSPYRIYTVQWVVHTDTSIAQLNDLNLSL